MMRENHFHWGDICLAVPDGLPVEVDTNSRGAIWTGQMANKISLMAAGSCSRSRWLGAGSTRATVLVWFVYDYYSMIRMFVPSCLWCLCLSGFAIFCNDVLMLCWVFSIFLVVFWRYLKVVFAFRVCVWVFRAWVGLRCLVWQLGIFQVFGQVPSGAIRCLGVVSVVFGVPW
jgi:hypothetical protein